MVSSPLISTQVGKFLNLSSVHSDITAMRTGSAVPNSEFDLSESFGRLDGDHSFKAANPGAFVEYSARRRRGGRVFYFNFPLAREMGLISSDWCDGALTPELSRVILDAFSLVIINEWDIENDIQHPAKDIKPGRYMATRYLQLQHPSRTGKTSGDGRGIWNGEIRHQGVTWDVTSSGTGATCLSPAVAREGRFFRSGDPKVCYGNGYNSLDDGLAAALMSEVLHAEGVSTERTLALISFPDGSSINVRAGRNLLRPSHLFLHLRQESTPALRRMLRYLAEREIANGSLNVSRLDLAGDAWVDVLIRKIAGDFARAAARFRSDYIFCWLDWDGDNILCDGGIIDYGSIRRFGAYHAGYRYDDVERFSTRIGEQKGKARQIVRTFAQLRDFVVNGSKKPLSHYRQSPLLELFEREFEREVLARFSWKLGIPRDLQECCLGQADSPHARVLRKLHRAFERLETRQCSRGVRRVADGETNYAVFLMGRFFRDYPGLRLSRGGRVGAAGLTEHFQSEFATRKDLRITTRLTRLWEDLEGAYDELCALFPGAGKALLGLKMRASVRNPAFTLTGNGALSAMEAILKLPRYQGQAAFERLLRELGAQEMRNAHAGDRGDGSPRWLKKALAEIDRYCEGL